MNRIQSIVSLENPDNTAIRLYEEGLFYKAYEYSAYLFVKHIKSYQVRKKFYKNIAQEVVAIGFPKNSFETVVPKKIAIEEEGKVKILQLNATVATDEYKQWKENIPLGNSKTAVKEVFTDNEKCVLDLIRNFRIENKTPMECMLFVSEIKTKL